MYTFPYAPSSPLSFPLQIIKRELGMTKDDADSLAEKYTEALKDKKVPEEVGFVSRLIFTTGQTNLVCIHRPFPSSCAHQVMAVIKEERDRLSTLEPRSSEFNVTRTYLDWLTCLPWGMRSNVS